MNEKKNIHIPIPVMAAIGYFLGYGVASFIIDCIHKR